MPARVGSFYSNPKGLPLGELHLKFVDEDGVTHQIPALHKHWVTRQINDHTLPLVWSGAQISSEIELDEWLFAAQTLREDFEFLLKCEQYEFWSYMLYEKRAHAAVVLFLHRTIPYYVNVHDQLKARNADVLEQYEHLLNLVLRIVCRLVTWKEARNSWFNKQHIAYLLYSSYLISVPMLCDLLIAVGDVDPQNTKILRHLFDSVLGLEPKYKNDIMSAISFFPAAFSSIQTQAENEGCEGAAGGDVDDDPVETPYDDVALYALDCAHTLALLVEMCPAVVDLCIESKLPQSIAKFYDNTIPYLYKNICSIKETAISLNWLNQARIQYLRAFRVMANFYIEQVLTDPEQSLLPSEGFLALLVECLSEQNFVVDYGRLYPVELDIDILKQACTELEELNAKYVAQAYQKESALAVNGTFGNVILNSIPKQTKPPKPATEKKEDTKKVENKVINGLQEKKKVEEANKVERDLEAETQAVLEVFPHLGMGFVRRVLLRYNNSEDAIAAILEENLPPDLANKNQDEPYIPPDPRDKLFHDTGISRNNVFDGDAYDIMSRDNPDCIIKQGKGMPNTAKDAAELLDDKKDLAKMRHIYQEYSLVAENSDDDKEYNDEYDDSYDAMLESESRLPKSKSLINDDDLSDGSSEESETETNDNNNAAKKPLDFCENPEITRARYEERRQAKWGNQQSSNNSNNSNKKDVVGNAKGQGQDKETLRNRQKKEANKSSRANHNRKAGASFKRSKGMFP